MKGRNDAKTSNEQGTGGFLIHKLENLSVWITVPCLKCLDINGTYPHATLVGEFFNIQITEKNIPSY